MDKFQKLATNQNEIFFEALLNGNIFMQAFYVFECVLFLSFIVCFSQNLNTF